MGKKEMNNYREACKELAEAFCEEYGFAVRDIDMETMSMPFIVLSNHSFGIKLSDMYYALTHNVSRTHCDAWIGYCYRAWNGFNMYIPIKEFTKA